MSPARKRRERNARKAAATQRDNRKKNLAYIEERRVQIIDARASLPIRDMKDVTPPRADQLLIAR